MREIFLLIIEYIPQVNELDKTRKSPTFEIRFILKGLPFPINSSNPTKATTIPVNFVKVNFSLRNIHPRRAIKIGAVPIIHPVFAAVVNLSPVI